MYIYTRSSFSLVEYGTARWYNKMFVTMKWGKIDQRRNHRTVCLLLFFFFFFISFLYLLCISHIYICIHIYSFYLSLYHFYISYTIFSLSLSLSLVFFIYFFLFLLFIFPSCFALYWFYSCALGLYRVFDRCYIYSTTSGHTYIGNKGPISNSLHSTMIFYFSFYFDFIPHPFFPRHFL